MATAVRSAGYMHLSHLRLLHTACHDRLHKAEKRDPDWRRAMGMPPRAD
ncbi:hypothetical protein [Caulobacter endophyticus]|nr:hypothetical protein [Caulobacter endophyticus]MDG2528194.1 hypothetical protein [Caulobacter endophyticus]